MPGSALCFLIAAIASRILPRFVSNLPLALESEMSNLIINNVNFGLRYDAVLANWKIISSSNIDLLGDFSLGRAGDISNSNLDTIVQLHLIY